MHIENMIGSLERISLIEHSRTFLGKVIRFVGSVCLCIRVVDDENLFLLCFLTLTTSHKHYKLCIFYWSCPSNNFTCILYDISFAVCVQSNSAISTGMHRTTIYQSYECAEKPRACTIRMGLSVNAHMYVDSSSGEHLVVWSPHHAIVFVLSRAYKREEERDYPTPYCRVQTLFEEHRGQAVHKCKR